jgi:hypothetical protein
LTDQQLLTLALAVIIPLSMMIYSNSRVTDVSKRIDDKIDDLQKHLDEKIDNAFQHMEMLLRLHESQHHNKH